MEKMALLVCTLQFHKEKGKGKKSKKEIMYQFTGFRALGF
jgi:hypothetical protein